MRYIAIILTAYLLGSFCTSIPISRRFYGGDVRNSGSGNAGATNMARVFGMKAGLVTLVCDIAKTVIAMLLGKYFGGEAWEALAGAVCITAHCYPLYFGFRGGKGVSVGAALGLMCGWRVFLCVMLLFLAVAVFSKKVSLGSISAAAALPIFAFLFGCGKYLLCMCIFSALLVVFMHRANIRRLIEGREGDFKPKKGR